MSKPERARSGSMKRKARALLYQLVSRLLRDGDAASDCQESVSDEVLGAEFSIVVKRMVRNVSRPIKVQDTHRRIVAVLDYDTPRSQGQIYVKLGKHRSGKSMSGGFRSCCADLIHWGVAKHPDGGGYGYILCADVPEDVLCHFEGILPKH